MKHPTRTYRLITKNLKTCFVAISVRDTLYNAEIITNKHIPNLDKLSDAKLKVILDELAERATFVKFK